MAQAQLDLDVLDGLLGETLDDLADLPSFEPFPAGLHECVLNFLTKEVNDKLAIEVTFTLQQTLEQEDADEKPATAGDKVSVLCFLQGEEDAVKMGQGKLKQILEPLKEHFGIETTRGIIEAADGSTVNIASSVRVDKKDKTRKYFNLIGLTVA